MVMDAARNQFLRNKDPNECFLLYIALKRRQVLLGLWRTAHGHHEQALMVKFLSNDFTNERWKSAAIKNAYKLISTGRYGTVFSNA